MMDYCQDDALKWDFLNGLLSPQDRILFEEHLAACPGCRGEIEELRKTAAAVAALTPPSVPTAWVAAVKDRLRAKKPSSGVAIPPIPAPARLRTHVLRYAVVTVGVAAGLVLLFWLAEEGVVQRWLPGLSAAGLGIMKPRAARTVDLVAWILSLHALLFVPSIIDNICRLKRRGGRRPHRGSRAGLFAC